MKNLLLITLLLAPAAGLLADHHQASENAANEGMSEEAMMAAMVVAATPGEPHAQMAAMTGSYLAEMTFFTEPGGEPQTATMTVERTMDLGGRVMVERWEGEMMEMPFEGHNRTGYNNVTGEYWGTWTDNWSTGLIVMRGNWDEAEGALVLEGENVHPLTGQPYRMKSINRGHGSVDSSMEMYEDFGEGMVKSFSVRMIKR